MNGSNKRSAMSGTERLGVLLLAAGYGTRLQRDVEAASHLNALHGVPKPLLPINGKPILSHWLSALSAIPALAGVVVITNAAHLRRYQEWAASTCINGCEIVVESDGSVDNATRLGAVKDISLGLEALRKTNADTALIIAGDTLLPGVDIAEYVSQFSNGSYDAATFAYPLNDMSDCVRRGMFKVGQDDAGVTLAQAVIEKPASPKEAPSNLASAPVYMLKKALWHTLDTFLNEREAEGAPLEKRDAPGFWLAWLVQKFRCRLFQVQTRIDIGGLQQYMDALWKYSLPEGERKGEKHVRAPNEPAVGRAHPRVGLLGNPSDGYGGKVIAVSIASEGYAEVIATPSDKFVVHTNPKHELRTEFESLADLEHHLTEHGLRFGARALVLAAAVLFSKEFKKFTEKNSVLGGAQGKAHPHSGRSLLNCQLTYSTTIPGRIGLSGSSALVLATLRALARFYNTSLEQMNGSLEVWPNLMRHAEQDMLGIACGLQDRVIQVMQGCVAMDFTPSLLAEPSTENHIGENPRWVRLPEDCLPEMYIAYYSEEHSGQCSGKVHGDLKARYANRDPVVLDTVEKLRALADSGQELLLQRAKDRQSDMSAFPLLVDKNFELRRVLVSDEGVGKQNIDLVRIAREVGFAAKMTGSGGCVLCVPSPVRELSKEEEQIAKAKFNEHGMLLRKVVILGRREWCSMQNG